MIMLIDNWSVNYNDWLNILFNDILDCSYNNVNDSKNVVDVDHVIDHVKSAGYSRIVKLLE